MREAEGLVRAAADAGSADAMYNLAAVLQGAAADPGAQAGGGELRRGEGAGGVRGAESGELRENPAEVARGLLQQAAYILT